MAEKHYYEQIEFTKSYLLPYFKEHLPNFENLKVLEVGCAEGGFVKVLHEEGLSVKGFELEQKRVDIAIQKAPELDIIQADITDLDIVKNLNDKYDLIVMRDVIEHIPNRDSAFKNIYSLLTENGYLFITFPPRFSGFAGHQQNGKSIFRFFAYIHLFPNLLIRFLGRVFKESDKLIEHIIENYYIGLSISKFEKLVKKHSFRFVNRDLFLFRPIYKLRFGVNHLKVPNIPIIREFTAFGCECLLEKNLKKDI